MSSSSYVRLAGLAGLLALSACTAVGPTFSAPQPSVPIASFPGQGQGQQPVASNTVEQAFDADWWKLFDDPLLVALEHEALAANLDLRAAAARVAQSRAALQASGAALLPSVSANASSLRERTSDKGMAVFTRGTDQIDSAPYKLFQYGVDASWELDLWGRLRRVRESAAAEADAARFDAEAMRVSLAAEVARSYLELRGVQSTLGIARANADIAAKSLHVAERRQQQGTATGFDTSVAAAQLASVEAAIPELEARRSALANALALLLALPPRALDARLAPPQVVSHLPARVPVGLPSELAHRRPDILRAEAQLHAATAQIGVAKANFYPSISLTGSFGFQSLSFSQAADWGARQFALGPVLHLPIFEGGRLAGNLALSEARQQETAIAYQRTVLGAWHEVDNALTAYRTVQQRAARLDLAVAENHTAVGHAQRRYAGGAGGYLDVLVTQTRVLDSENAAARGRTEMALAMVALYKALGGGWNPDAASASVGNDR